MENQLTVIPALVEGGSSQATWHHCALLKMMCLLVRRHEKQSVSCLYLHNHLTIFLILSASLVFIMSVPLMGHVVFPLPKAKGIEHTQCIKTSDYYPQWLFVLVAIEPKSTKHLISLAFAQWMDNLCKDGFLLRFPTVRPIILSLPNTFYQMLTLAHNEVGGLLCHIRSPPYVYN